MATPPTIRGLTYGEGDDDTVEGKGKVTAVVAQSAIDTNADGSNVAIQFPSSKIIIPANTLVAGKWFRYRGQGLYTTGGSAPILTWGARIDGSSIGDTGARLGTANISSLLWTLDLDMIYQADGKLYVNGWLTRATSQTAFTGWGIELVVTTVDPTLGHTIDMFSTINDGTASTSITLTTCIATVGALESIP